ncbi:tRNA pseudouridine(13) synthase TruD [Sulfolobus sp. S-194]|uniref:tRNA pseudouridine(13) synthase TruD n=1 Tax=Sulfolobus sp. S-194 TaxID=2512240 RepID=UPI001436CE88|nr:tRNA pseudouridine(13) synthase TruD [Sulfolobus sp. S-194]
MLGMEKYFIDEDWGPLKVFINRPYGFKVIEEISYKPASEWKGSIQGKYAVYLLRKQGIDHFTVISEISKILHSKIHYIGIKDTNAITEQIVYTTNVKNIIEKYENDKFILTFLGYSNSKFNHTGNIFEIEIETDDIKELEKRVNRLRSMKYLPSYIGYQRFGTKRPITHVIGKMLVLREWQNTIDFLIGYPFESESEPVKKARYAYMKGDLKEALELFPKRFRDERIAIKLLLRNENYFNILRNLQTPLIFYIEAYQSYLFNKYLSRIIDPTKIDENLIIKIPTSYENCDTICKEIFREEGLVNTNFKIKELKLNVKDLIRKAYTLIRNLTIKDKKITFALDRGIYATIVIREIARTDPRLFT